MTEQYVHLPNLSLIRLCNEKFGVSRGLYNTIDILFYERGFQDVIVRRKAIIEYLQYVQEQNEVVSEKVKFQRGKLQESIDEYLYDQS